MKDRKPYREKRLSSKLHRGWTDGLLPLFVLIVSCTCSGFYEGRGMYPVMALIFVWAACALIFRTSNDAAVGRMPIRLPVDEEGGGDGGKNGGENEGKNEGKVRVWKIIRPPGSLIIVIPPFGIAALYLAHLPFAPLSMQGTLDQLLRWSFYGVLAAALTAAASAAPARSLLRAGPAACAAILTAAGFAVVYGLAELPHAVLRTANAELSTAGARLGGLLQYPNTLGAVFGALLLERLAALSQPAVRPAAVRRAISAGLALACAASLLLTESRGAWACTAVGWALALALAKGAARRQLLLQTAIAFGGGLWLYRQLAAAGLAPATLPGLLQLAGTAAAVLVLSSAASRFGAPSARRLSRFAATAACGSWAGLALALPLPDSGGEVLVRTGTSTVSARLLMYRDALGEAGHYAWWGRGGEVWRSVYRSIQSEPYVGAQVHSGYLDMLLNLGIPGLVLLIIWLAGMGMSLWSRRSLYLAPYLVLVLHAAVDFDMSYGLVWLLILWVGTLGMVEPRATAQFPLSPPCLSSFPGRVSIAHTKPRKWDGTYSSGLLKICKLLQDLKGRGSVCLKIMTQEIRNSATSPTSTTTSPISPTSTTSPTSTSITRNASRTTSPRSTSSSNSTTNTSASPPAIREERARGERPLTGNVLFKWTLSTAAAVILFILTTVSLRNLASERITSHAGVLRTSGHVQEAKLLLEQAVRLAPYRLTPRLTLANILPPEEAARVLHAGIRYNRLQGELWWALAQVEVKLEQPLAAAHIGRAVELDRYNSRKMTAVLHELSNLARRLQRAGRFMESRAAAYSGLQLFNRYSRSAEGLAARESVRNDRKFRITELARREAGVLRDILGNEAAGSSSVFSSEFRRN